MNPLKIYPVIYPALIPNVRRLLAGRAQKTVSLEAKLGRTFISEVLSGKANNPTAKNLKKLADYLGVSVHLLLYGDAGMQLPVVGTLWAGGKIIYLEHYVNSNGENIKIPDMALEKEAITLGENMSITLEEGWKVEVGKKHRGEEVAKCVDKLCAIKRVDGLSVCAKIKQGSKPGRYHLLGFGGFIEDVEIEWCAIVERIELK